MKLKRQLSTFLAAVMVVSSTNIAIADNSTAMSEKPADDIVSSSAVTVNDEYTEPTGDIAVSDASSEQTVSDKDSDEISPDDNVVLMADNENIVAYAVEGGNIYFDKEKGEITAVDESITSADIPRTIGGVEVVSVGSNAFEKCTLLTKVTLPDSVTSIESYAFSRCSSLTNVILSDGITSIGNNAFYSCKALTDINIPAGVTSIGNNTFSGCSSLTSINIPDDVTSIGDSAFYNCKALTDINIPKGVTSIGSSAFEGCSSLTNIILPDGVTSIGSSTFEGCSSLTNIILPDGVTSIGSSAFEDCSLLTSINIPAGVTSIKGYAFCRCSALKSISLPNDITYIGQLAFCGCSALTSITLPDGITSVEEAAFEGCSSLTDINIPAGVTSIGEQAFFGCSLLTDINIPDGVTSIERYTFSDCSSLTSINIPDGVTSIGTNAFRSCSALSEITLPNSITDFGDGLFADCCSLTKVTLPDSMTSIGYSLFSNCALLTRITIPDSVTSIGQYAFSGCTSLTEITIPNSVTSIEGFAFKGCSSLVSIELPKGLDTVRRCTFWDCTFLSYVIIPEGVVSIEDNVFNNCKFLKSIEIPTSVTSVDNSAFYNCNRLSDVYYGGAENDWNTISISLNGNDKFLTATRHYNSKMEQKPEIFNDYYTIVNNEIVGADSSIINAVIPEGITAIRTGAFCLCNNLKSIVIPKSVTEINEFTFVGEFGGSKNTPLDIYYAGSKSDWANVKRIHEKNYMGPNSEWAIPRIFKRSLIHYNSTGPVDSSVKGEPYAVTGGNIYIYNGIVIDADNTVISVTVPDSVKAIGDYAFKGCTKLKEIHIPDGCQLCNGVFEQCTSLSNVSLPSDIEIIPKETFEGCSALKNIKIPEGTFTIGERAFANSGIISVDISGNLEYINKEAFLNCKSLADVNITNDVEIYTGVFGGCTALKTLSFPKNVRFEEEKGDYYINSFGAPDYYTAPVVFDGCSKDLLLKVYYDSNAASQANKEGVNYEYVDLVIYKGFRYTVNGDNTVTAQYYDGTSKEVVYTDNVNGMKVIGCPKLPDVPNVESITAEKGFFESDTAYEGCAGILGTYGVSAENMNKNLTITAPKNSLLEKIALENNIKFVDNGETAADMYDYYLNNDDTIQLLRYFGTKSKISIPDEYLGHKVTYISIRGIFEDPHGSNICKINSFLHEISYNGYTFNKDNMTLSIDNKNEKLSADGFIDTCSLHAAAIENLVIPEGVTEIEEGWSGNNGTLLVNLKSIDLPSTLKTVGANAFLMNRSAKVFASSFNIDETGNTATQIFKYDENGLYGNPPKQVSLPRSLENIGEHAFGYYIDYGENYDSANGIDDYEIKPISGFKIYCYRNSAGEKYAVDNGFDYEYISEETSVSTESTSEATTESTSEATTESTSEATTESTSEATTESTSEATTEPTTETTTDYDVENGLIVVPVEGGNIYIDKDSGEVADCDEGVVSVNIPDKVNGIEVKSISAAAFSGCKSLKSITIPDTVTAIAENAFADCISLIEIHCTKGSFADNKALYPENTEIKYTEALLYGDADGDGSLIASDAAAVLQKVLKSTYKLPIEDATPDYEKYLDVDGNGKLEAADAAMILQKVLKSTYQFSIEK